jgi:hypothetical protein
VEERVRDWLERALARTTEFSERLAGEAMPAEAVARQRGFIIGITETLRALDLIDPDEWTEWATRLLVLTHSGHRTRIWRIPLLRHL